MTGRLPMSITRFAEHRIPATVKDHLRGAIGYLLRTNVETYREYRDTHDVPIWYFDEDRTYRFGEPDAYNEIPAEISKLFGTHHSPQPYVMELADVTIIGEQGLLVTADGPYLVFNYERELSEDTTRDAAREVAYDVLDALGTGTWPFATPLPGTDVPEYDLVVSLLNRWARNYSHWTEECLPLLEGVQEYTSMTGEQPLILIPPDPPAFIPDSLEVLGYDADEYLELPASRIHAKRLVVPSPRRFSSDTGKDYIRMLSGLEWLRDSVISNVPEVDDTPSRLFISREDASTRRIRNRSAVESRLSDLGFETVVLTELDYVTQKQFFSDADVIVGTHGAGLNEIVFADDAIIIELFGDYIVPTFYEIATGMGHTYACLHCEDIDGDIEVDVDELLDLLATLPDTRITRNPKS